MPGVAVTVRRVAAVVPALAALAAGVSSASPASPSLPLPLPRLIVSGPLEAISVFGTRIAVATGNGCAIRIADLTPAVKLSSVEVPSAIPCSDTQDGDNATFAGLWLGKNGVEAAVDDAPSPHGETWSLWRALLPRGPLRKVGDEWGWSEDTPTQYGCAWSVVAGGGVIASTEVPNRLGVENGVAKKPICIGRSATEVALSGATQAKTRLDGQWTLLATDGKRLALARLDAEGSPTGGLALIGSDGKALPAPHVDPSVVKKATAGWLTRDGLVLRTATGINGPGWTFRARAAATVSEGRLLYVQGDQIRIRRVRDGTDRPLLKLPRDALNTLLAAGSFGVAVAVGRQSCCYVSRTAVYRLPWRLVDRALPAD